VEGKRKSWSKSREFQVDTRNKFCNVLHSKVAVVSNYVLYISNN
jgi:hypothetical protein